MMGCEIILVMTGIGALVYTLFGFFILPKLEARQYTFPIPGWRIHKQTGKIEQYNWIGDGHWMKSTYEEYQSSYHGERRCSRNG